LVPGPIAVNRQEMRGRRTLAGWPVAAKVFGIPTVLTTVLEERGGLLIQQLQDVFPDQKPINRTFVNAWQDERVVDAVKATGRKKLIITGLYTRPASRCPRSRRSATATRSTSSPTVLGLAEVQGKHVSGSGIAFAWETQLLATRPEVGRSLHG
jgi:Isochorismatase family